MTDDPVEEAALGDDLGLREYEGSGRSHRRERRRSSVGCLVAVLLLGLILGVLWVGLTRGVDWAQDFFADAEDYPGPGSGKVQVEVAAGASATDVAHTLEELDVVASAEAFINVATESPDDAAKIKAGTYTMKLKMSAEDAFTFLVTTTPRSDCVEGNGRICVLVPEGIRAVDVVELLAEKTEFTEAQFQRVLDAPRTLGLPAYAEGNPEGYLFPAKYAFDEDDTPQSMLRAMVDRWHQAAEAVGLEEAANDLGYSPHELMTIASLVEAEARGDYQPQVARVIYNRLETDGAPTYGLLQLDATVNYAHGRDIGARTTEADRQIDSPYNTYEYEGLPPGPIEAPGQAAMEAAANPSDGDWFFYVTVNLRTGETKFAETLEEHNQNVQELNEYCANESDRC